MNGPDQGHVVYFIIAGHFVKVGYSNNVWSRVRELQTGNPYELILAHTIGYKTRKEAMQGERKWRQSLAKCGRSRLGEWVELEDDMIGPLARDLNRRHEGSWTAYRIAQDMLNSKAVDIEDAMMKYGLRARLASAAA